MNAAISSPAYWRLTVGSWLRLMRPLPLGPRARNWAIASGVIGVCFSAVLTLLPLRRASWHAMSGLGPEAAVRCAASIRQQFGCIETNQNFPPAHSSLAAALAHLGQLDEAQ